MLMRCEIKMIAKMRCERAMVEGYVKRAADAADDFATPAVATPLIRYAYAVDTLCFTIRARVRRCYADYVATLPLTRHFDTIYATIF